MFGDDTFPDMTFILDGDPVFFHKRMLDQRGGDEMNHFDEIGFEFKNKSRLMYRHLAATYPERYVVIDAEQSLEQVMAQMVPHLMQIDAHLRKRPSE
ncbi:thymidylate kinase [compost metagenome]